MSAPASEQVLLRPERAADRTFLFDLYASTRAAEMAQLDWSPEHKGEFIAAQFHAQTTHYDDVYPDAERLVIESAGAPIGRLYVDRRDDEIEIVDIALVPAMRGRGIGRNLLQHIIDEGRVSRRRVRIYVEHFNPARGLYNRLGFRQVDSHGIYHLMEVAAGGA